MILLNYDTYDTYVIHHEAIKKNVIYTYEYGKIIRDHCFVKQLKYKTIYVVEAHLVKKAGKNP